MRKIFNRINKIFMGFGILLFSICNKVNALAPAYGIERHIEKVEPSFFERFIKPILSSLIIIGAIITGVIVYWKKSKNNNVQKNKENEDKNN